MSTKAIRRVALTATTIAVLTASCTGTHVPLGARIVLSSTTVQAGHPISGYVEVENDNDGGVRVATCGSPFAVALGNERINPDAVWTSCLQYVTIPVGRSTWPVIVSTFYPTCEVGGGSCTLPPGDYRATLLQWHQVVRAPAPVAVRVTG
jgi:hypothetical protein